MVTEDQQRTENGLLYKAWRHRQGTWAEESWLYGDIALEMLRGEQTSPVREPYAWQTTWKGGGK